MLYYGPIYSLCKHRTSESNNLMHLLILCNTTDPEMMVQLPNYDGSLADLLWSLVSKTNGMRKYFQ